MDVKPLNTRFALLQNSQFKPDQAIALLTQLKAHSPGDVLEKGLTIQVEKKGKCVVVYVDHKQTSGKGPMQVNAALAKLTNKPEASETDKHPLAIVKKKLEKFEKTKDAETIKNMTGSILRLASASLDWKVPTVDVQSGLLAPDYSGLSNRGVMKGHSRVPPAPETVTSNNRPRRIAVTEKPADRAPKTAIDPMLDNPFAEASSTATTTTTTTSTTTSSSQDGKSG